MNTQANSSSSQSGDKSNLGLRWTKYRFLAFLTVVALLAGVFPAGTSAAPMYSSAFSSDFTIDAAGWTPSFGSWTVADGFYQDSGSGDFFDTSGREDIYKTFTYEVSMKRVGGCKTCANFLMFRGNDHANIVGKWETGYYFAYTNNGYFIVGYYKNWTFHPLLPNWTKSNKINKTGWNTLKVTMKGKFMQVFINDKLVASGNVSKFARGQVGLGMYLGDPTGTLQVDWAELSLSAPTSSLGAGSLTVSETTISGDSGGQVNPDFSP